MDNNWKDLLIDVEFSIKEAMKVINQGAQQVALVTDSNLILKGVITDGDIRRGILAGVELFESVEKVMNKTPIVARDNTCADQLKRIMQDKQILSIPIVNEFGKLVGFRTLQDTLKIEKRNNPVFIMAGGFGTRLKPLTDTCPKPMLKVGGKPMLEILINNFKAHGFYKFYISTHYLPEIIHAHFGDGSDFGIEIEYVHEDSPLGTGGALSLLPSDIPKSPLIMINGDILTSVDFAKVVQFHEQSGADATMCVRDYEVKVPFGVIEGEGHKISGIVEKPTYRYFVNAGIYVISNDIIATLAKNKYLDMPTLFEQKQEEGRNVLKFPIHEYWLDIGRHDDFQKAQLDIYDLELI